MSSKCFSVALARKRYQSTIFVPQNKEKRRNKQKEYNRGYGIDYFNMKKEPLNKYIYRNMEIEKILGA